MALEVADLEPIDAGLLVALRLEAEACGPVREGD